MTKGVLSRYADVAAGTIFSTGVMAGIPATVKHFSDKRISDTITKDASLPNVVNTIAKIERRSSDYYTSQEAIDTANAVLKMANGTATKADYALIERSEGARRVVLSAEGTKAWDSLKAVAQKDADARIDMKASKSGIGMKKSVSEYPYDMKKVISDYIDSTNEDFKSFIKSVNADKNTPQNKKYLFGNVAERTSKIIEKITGINVEGFKTAIESRMIWHIEKDHGVNGKTDKSMSNIDDLARIEYVLNNYDDIVYGGTTKSYTTVKENGRTKLADTVVYSKKINGTYYVVQAVPNAKAKTLYVVSAYINKKGASQLTDADNAPVFTSEDGSVVTPNDSISKDKATVNSKDMRDGEIYSQGKRVSFEKGERVGGNVVYNEESRKFAKKNHEGYKVIQTMAKDLGMKVKFVKGLVDGDGNVLDGVITSEGIFINTEAKNPTRWAATHEFSHRMKQTGGKAWQKYQDYVIKHLKETGKYDAMYNAKKGAYAENEIDEEIAADYIGELFSDVKELAEFIRESRQTAFSVRNMWYKVLDKLGLSDEKKKAQRMWASAYREAMKNSDVKYEDGAHQSKSGTRVDDSSNSKYNEISEKLTRLEWKMFYNSLGELKRGMWFPQTIDGDYIFETDDKLIFTDGNYKNPKVNYIVEFESLNAEEIEYGKEIIWNEAENGKICEECCEIAQVMLGKGTITSTNSYTSRTYGESDNNQRKGTNSKTTDRGTRKSVSGTRVTDNKGNALTKGQQEYFKNSKVRDKNGNLLVMYQGSKENFTVFDRKKSSYGNLYGRGFYFTDSISHANQYGNARAYYLNIEHPVSTTETTITREQFRKFLEAVAENEDYGLENYGYGSTVDSVLESTYGKSDFLMLNDVSQTAIGDLVEAVEFFNKINGTDYDGIILDTETVTFNSEQAKLTTNENPTSNPDIRKSVAGTRVVDNPSVNDADTSASSSLMSRLLEENARLRDNIEDLYVQMNQAEGKLNTRAVNDVAKSLKEKYGSKISIPTLRRELAKLYTYMSGKNVDGAVVLKRISSIAKNVIDRATETIEGGEFFC